MASRNGILGAILVLCAPLLVVLTQSTAFAACSPTASIEKEPWGNIVGVGRYSGCTIKTGDRLCLQKEIGYQNWSSVVDCRGVFYLNNGSGYAETFPYGCAYPTDENYYFGKYRALLIAGGKRDTSPAFFCPSDY